MVASRHTSVVVIGASGDLARKKIFPALFSLYCQQLLPEPFHVFGFARSELTDAEFRGRIAEHLTCRYSPEGQCDLPLVREFLERCRFVQGEYGSRDAFLDLYLKMRDVEHNQPANRLFLLGNSALGVLGCRPRHRRRRTGGMRPTGTLVARGDRETFWPRSSVLRRSGASHGRGLCGEPDLSHRSLLGQGEWCRT